MTSRKASIILHASIILGFYSLTHLKKIEMEFVEVPIVEVVSPKEIQKIVTIQKNTKVILKSVNESESKSKREIFGFNRRSLTDSTAHGEGISVKKGNTLTKDIDSLILNDSDADTLPTPTEEYLVSDMPQVLSEVRPLYPREAKEKGLEGSVVMDVLIDNMGKVREVSVIEGEDIFRNGAINAMKKFLFKPAKVDGRAVAIRIRYSLKFLLEY